MNQRFEDLILQAQTGGGTELLEFNDYLALRGYGVSRMEVAQAEGGKVDANFSYGVTPQPFPGDDDHWMHHFDPVRSAAYVRENVQFAREDGALFDYKVWALSDLRRLRPDFVVKQGTVFPGKRASHAFAIQKLIYHGIKAVSFGYAGYLNFYWQLGILVDTFHFIFLKHGNTMLF